jgi:hypothetical protein
MGDHVGFPAVVNDCEFAAAVLLVLGACKRLMAGGDAFLMRPIGLVNVKPRKPRPIMDG